MLVCFSQFYVGGNSVDSSETGLLVKADMPHLQTLFISNCRIGNAGEKITKIWDNSDGQIWDNWTIMEIMLYYSWV